jgi:hypothetical protein
MEEDATALAEFKEKFKTGTFEINDHDVKLFLDALKEAVDGNADIQDLLQDMKEEGAVFRINFELTSEPYWAAWIRIEEGKFETGWFTLDDPTLRVMASKEVLVGLLKNEIPAMKAYSEGLVQIEGELVKAAPLGMIVSALGETMGLF